MSTSVGRHHPLKTGRSGGRGRAFRSLPPALPMSAPLNAPISRYHPHRLRGQCPPMLERPVVEPLAVVLRHHIPLSKGLCRAPRVWHDFPRSVTISCVVDTFQRRLSAELLWGWFVVAPRLARNRQRFVRQASRTPTNAGRVTVRFGNCAPYDIAAPEHRVLWGMERENLTHESVL
jgi:hypothetical protein